MWHQHNRHFHMTASNLICHFPKINKQNKRKRYSTKTVTQTTLLVGMSNFHSENVCDAAIKSNYRITSKKKLTRHCDQLPHNEFCVHAGCVLTTNIRANELRTVPNNALRKCTYNPKLEGDTYTRTHARARTHTHTYLTDLPYSMCT